MLGEIVVFERGTARLMWQLLSTESIPFRCGAFQIKDSSHFKSLEHVVHHHQISFLLVVTAVAPLHFVEPVEAADQRLRILFYHGVIAGQCVL